MMTTPFAGKQLWIHKLTGSAADLIRTAVDLGCSGVLVKAGDGANYWPQIEGVKQAALDLGQPNLMIGAWFYNYADNIASEAIRVHAQHLASPG